MKKLWICGKLIGLWSTNHGRLWEFQGVFTTKEKAVKACREDAYFIFPCEVDEEMPHETVEPKEYYYPLLNMGKKWTSRQS